MLLLLAVTSNVGPLGYGAIAAWNERLMGMSTANDIYLNRRTSKKDFDIWLFAASIFHLFYDD